MGERFLATSYSRGATWQSIKMPDKSHQSPPQTREMVLEASRPKSAVAEAARVIQFGATAALRLAWHCKGLLLCRFALDAPPGTTSDPTIPQPACKGNPGKFCTKTCWKMLRKKVIATFTGFSRPEGTIMLI